jgi:hypothetical protein
LRVQVTVAAPLLGASARHFRFRERARQRVWPIADHRDSEADREVDDLRRRSDSNPSRFSLQAPAECSRRIKAARRNQSKLIAGYSRPEHACRQPGLAEQVGHLPDHLVAASEPVDLVDNVQAIDIHVDN